MVTQPQTFMFTQQEAKQLQALQSARQTKFARRGIKNKLVCFAVPVLALIALFAIDWLFYDGNIPRDIFIGAVLAFLVGFLSILLISLINVADWKKRMLADTPQVWEQRQVKIDETGVSQSTETSDVMFKWSTIGPVEQNKGLVFLWLNKFQAIAIPTRAFASDADANAFESEARRLAKANWVV